MLCELALRLGLDLDVLGAAMASRQLFDAVPFYGGLTLEEIGGRGVRWQQREAASSFPAGDAGRRRTSPPALADGVGQRATQTPAGRSGTGRCGTPPRSVTRPRSSSCPPSGSRPEMVLATVDYAEDWWIQVIKAIIIFAVALQLVPIVLLAERKLLGRMQNRYGPNRVGPFGALQPIADILKLVTKEQFRPSTSVGVLFAIAPVISILTACAAFAIIPFGDTQNIFGTQVGLYGIDVSIGPLYLFACGSIAFYGFILGGWSSDSKYSMLGSMRAAAQLVSYEVSQGLALVGVIITAQTLSLTQIVHAQTGMWFFIPQFVGFLIFLVASFAETNRAPFDLTEADTELVGGYNTEYGGGRFASYYFAEYLNVLVVAGVVATIFFDGWLLPFGIHPPGWVDPFVVLAKMAIVTFLFIWAGHPAAPALRPADALRLEDPAAAGDGQRARDGDLVVATD